MYNAKNLKPRINVTDSQVECPVIGCSHRVVRQRAVFRRRKEFQCPHHKIFISPSTFEYPNYSDNLLWKDAEDIALLECIKSVKRESRMARDNSEDAISWNIFRYLEKTGSLAHLLSQLTGTNLQNADLIYWSYSQRCKRTLSDLNMARLEFGETIQRGSEPDLIVVSDDTLFFIEAKVTATNNTTPSDKGNYKKYVSGGNFWYDKVFTSDYDIIANKARKYELLRFWLLGTWIASKINYKFYLINLVRKGYETDIEKMFTRHINPSTFHRFLRITWEEIYNYILTNLPLTEWKNAVLSYFEYKTIGYNGKQELQRAFSIERKK